MGVKKSVKKGADWRQDNVNPKVRKMFSSPDVLKNLESNPDVLKDLESSLRFLELLNEMRLYGSSAWKAADKSYHANLDEKVKRGEELDKFTARYYKMFRVWVDNTPRAKEDFNGEFSESVKHVY